MLRRPITVSAQPRLSAGRNAVQPETAPRSTMTDSHAREQAPTPDAVEGASESRADMALLPIMAVVLVPFPIIRPPLPVPPLHVHQGLGLGTFLLGLVTGHQFGAALIPRLWAGHHA